MMQRSPCSPYLLKPLRSLDEARTQLAARQNRNAAVRAAHSGSSAPAALPKEITMKPKQLRNPERKKAWESTKQAVGAYARNPCAATEIKVAAALGEVKRLCQPCAAARGKPEKKQRAG